MIIELENNPEVVAVFIDGRRVVWPIRADVEENWVEVKVVKPAIAQEQTILQISREAEKMLSDDEVGEAETETKRLVGKISLVRKQDVKRK